MNKLDIKNINNLANGNLLLNESMTKHTTFGIGGNADCYIMPKTKEELIEKANIKSGDRIQVGKFLLLLVKI